MVRQKPGRSGNQKSPQSPISEQKWHDPSVIWSSIAINKIVNGAVPPEPTGRLTHQFLFVSIHTNQSVWYEPSPFHPPGNRRRERGGPPLAPARCGRAGHPDQGLRRHHGRRCLRGGGGDQGQLFPPFQEQGSDGAGCGGALEPCHRQPVRAGTPSALPDPRDRVLAYLDLRKALIRGAPPEFTCLLGTMVQETFETWPRLRQACDAGILGHAQTVARDLALAKALYAPHAPGTPRPWRCSPRPRCRAPSSWPRRRAAPTSCSRASITCDSMSRTCWAPMTRRLPP
jgi:hypothetical protein